MNVSDGIAAGALVVSVVALWFAWGREKRDERRFQREEEAAVRGQQARLTVDYVETRNAGPGKTTYLFAVTNTGKVAAHHVVVRVEDAGRRVVARSPFGLNLLPDERRLVYAQRAVPAWVPPLTPVLEWRTEDDQPRTRRSRLLFDEVADDEDEVDANTGRETD